MSDTLNAACWRTHTSRAGLGFKRKNSSPLATETMPASHAHEAEQDAGGVKVVLITCLYSAPAVVRSLPFQAVVQNTVERKKWLDTHSGLERMEMKEGAWSQSVPPQVGTDCGSTMPRHLRLLAA